jgi:starch phosphorylase
MSILNSVRMGQFSSDRSIQEYCDQIWRVSPLTVNLDDFSPITGQMGGELTCNLDRARLKAQGSGRTCRL